MAKTKSGVLKELAEELGIPYINVQLSEPKEDDLRGYPQLGDLDSPVPNHFDHTKRGFIPQ